MRHLPVLLLICALSAPALADDDGPGGGPGAPDTTLSAGQILRIEFTTRASTLGVPNALYAFLGNIQREQPFGTMSGALYDGDTLLGTSTSATGCCGTGVYSMFPAPMTWKSAGSPWNFPAGDPAVVDFGGILGGTIDGRIDIAIDAGRFRFDIDSVALSLIEATGPNFGSTIPPAPTISSVAVVPEPSPVMMSMAGGVLLAGLSLWRQRRSQYGVRLRGV